MSSKLSEAMDHIHDTYIMDAVNTYRVPEAPAPRGQSWRSLVVAAMLLLVIGVMMIPVFNALDTSGGTNPLQPSTIITSATQTTGSFTTAPTVGSTTVPTDSATTTPTSGSTTAPTGTTAVPTGSSTTSTTTGKPSLSVTLKTDKAVCAVNENITFTITSNGASNTLWIYRVDGDWQNSYKITGSSYVLSFGWSGEYKAHVETTDGNTTQTSATIYFTIIEADSTNAPTFATIRCEKTHHNTGDTVNFTMNSDGTTNDLWIYCPDGTTQYFRNVGSTYSYTPTQLGVYNALVETWIGATSLCSAKVSFAVIDPDNPCPNGHDYLNGFCINCAAADPNYDPCANGHTYQNGFCVHCSKKDPNYNPCDNGQHNYYNGYCLRCLKADPDFDPCDYGHIYSNGVCTRCGSPMPSTGDTSSLEEEYGATLKIIIPSHNAKDANAWQNIVVSQFKTLYPNVTIQFVTATWSDWYQKLMVHYTTGDPIDLIYDGVNNEPKFAISGITQPLQNYINMDNPNLKMSVMDECFKYGGNYYVATTEVNFGVIFYNKDMFEAAGLDDPMDLYKNGQWNWETFTNLAKALTDKDAGIYGFSTNFPYLFYGANATSTLKLDANGNCSLNTDDPAFIAALEIIYDGSANKSGWSGFDTVYHAMDSFQTGKTAMLGTFSVYESNINDLANIGAWPPINYGVVPMPYGPNNPTGKNMIISNGWSIGAGSDCPAHVGKLIDMLVDGNAAYLAQQSAKLPAASVELYEEMSKNIFCVNTRDSIIDGGEELFQAVADGWSVAWAIEEYKPKYQAMIDQCTVPALPWNN